MHPSTQWTHYCGEMEQQQASTNMIHYECEVCGVSATCVITPSAELAWLDHMATHASPKAFQAWTWTAVPLQFDASDPLSGTLGVSSTL